MKISLLHATRANPKQALKTRDIWLDHATDRGRVEHIFAIQSDDYASSLAFACRDCRKVEIPPPPAWASSSVANWNAAAAAATGDILVCIADDLTPPLGWDLELALAMPTDRAAALYVPDQMSDDMLMRHPVINRRLYEKRGYIFDPDFYGVYCDNDLSMWLRRHRISVIRHGTLSFRHDHPLAKGNPRAWSDVTKHQNSQQAYAYGQETMARKWPELVFNRVRRTHSVWIGETLSVMELLTLALLVKHGHRPTLWVKADIWRQDTPPGVEIKFIGDDVIPPIRFAGKPHPSIPNGGIGSYAQWSDYFALTRLANDPGALWLQLDVAATVPINAGLNTFTTYVGGIQTCCFTLAPGAAHSSSEIIRRLITEKMTGLDWHDTMTAVARHLDELGVIVTIFDNFKDCGCLPTSPYNQPVPPDQRPALIHWSNATHHQSKHEPVPGSLYAELIEENLDVLR